MNKQEKINSLNKCISIIENVNNTLDALFEKHKLSLLGRTAILKPKTKKGKERIKQYGASGIVLDVKDKVIFSCENGPWLLIEAADPTSRWVHIKFDKDFEVEITLE